MTTGSKYPDIEDMLDELGAGYIDDDWNYICPSPVHRTNSPSPTNLTERRGSLSETSDPNEIQVPVVSTTVNLDVDIEFDVDPDNEPTPESHNNTTAADISAVSEHDQDDLQRKKLLKSLGLKKDATLEELRAAHIAKWEAKRKCRREKLRHWKSKVDKIRVGAAFQYKFMQVQQLNEPQ